MQTKNLSLFFIFLIINVTQTYAQVKPTKINTKNQERYITTTIGYPIAGLYFYFNQTEPTTQLNDNGSGIMQNEDLSKESIIWGIECSQSGIPILKEGFDSAAYSFWYKKENLSHLESEDKEEWIYQSFTIHFNKQKMFISGNRVKEYIEPELKKQKM
ncbi:MAG: hypothetical protein RL619_795 [Bacteroidota bacterium]|jgi:hypothetical protein